MYFYSHLINIETIIIELDQLEMTDKHKKHLSSLIDTTIHQTTLEVVLTHLDKRDKIIFLKKFGQNPADKEIMEFLTSKIEDIEDKIIQAIEKLKDEFKKDIKEVKNIHGFNE